MSSSERETETLTLSPPCKRVKTNGLESLPDHLKYFKPSGYIPEDLVENILSFFPVKEAIQVGLLSTRFKKTWQLSRHLIFDLNFSTKHPRLEAISIINRTLLFHTGRKVQTFVLYIDHRGKQPLVEAWIMKCIVKGVEELELDFYDSGETVRLSFDLSNVRTLTVLKLSYVHFKIPLRPRGLKFLTTLVLTRQLLDPTTIESLFLNCFLLERLELIGCENLRELRIAARKQLKFSCLKVACCRYLYSIVIDAPSLKSFHYCGIVIPFRFFDILQLKDVALQYVRAKNLFESFKVINVVFDLCHIQVLSTTSVFLEGLTKRMIYEDFREVQYRFWNLKEFQLFMEPPSYCNLFDIANFLKNCPVIERLYIDVNDFKFQLGLYWEAHQKQQLKEFRYKFDNLKFVEIMGFKCHEHELDIVQFFLENARHLEMLNLVTPKKNKARIYVPDYERISAFLKGFGNIKIHVYDHNNYKSPIPAKHIKEWR